MNIFKLLKFLYKAKTPHFLSVPKKQWERWSILIRIAVILNDNYRHCVIYRKKYKFLNNIVVVGLKWSGKNVRRRTTGFAREFIDSNKNARCIYCETKLNYENATTDHIIPISEVGNNSLVNLMVCCFDCNNERGNLEFTEYLRVKNPKYKKTKIPYI